MRKNKLITALLLGMVTVCSAAFISCGDKHTKHSYKKVIDGSTFTMACECGKISKGYRIQFVYAEDGSEADEGIEVSWTDKNGNKVTSKTNEFGYVEALQLEDSSYTLSVNEDTLPSFNGEKYLYYSNAFNTQENGIGFTIPLFSVDQPYETQEIVVAEDTYDCSSIKLNKVYFATINNATQTLWFNLQNDGYGKYTVDATMVGDTTVELERYFGSFAYVNPKPDSKADKSKTNKLTYTVINTDAIQNSMFCIKAPNAASYPVTVPLSVTITYVPENKKNVQENFISPKHFKTEADSFVYYTTERGTNKPIEQKANSLKPIASVQKWKDVEGSVISDLTESQFTAMNARNDGYYYTSNNQLVYVKLKTPSIFENLTLASYASESNPPSFAIYNIVEQDEYGFYTRRDNYFGFVQAYAALANNDGLYPLTEEMLDYLKFVAKKEHHTVNELLCTYPEQTNEFTQGSGTQSTPFTLTLNEQTLGYYNLSIASGGKVYVELSGTMDIVLTFNSNVKATVDSALYEDEYISVSGKKTIEFTTKDGNAQNFILKIAKYDDPYYLEVGNNPNTIAPNTIVNYEFIAPKAGTFDISNSNSNVVVTVLYDGDTYEVNGTVTFTLNEGESLEFAAETLLEMDTAFILSIQENTLEE